MCHVSNKLQFCTCSTKDINRLKHFWVFHRLVKGKNEIIIGEAIPPYHIDTAIHLHNKEALLNLINSGKAFDVELHPAKGDLLEVSFSVGSNEGRIWYGFEYSGKRWKEKAYDSFMWRWHHEEERFGKIRNAVRRGVK